MSKIKTCVVCGKKYEYCGHCDKNGQNHRWKINYCSENCKDIFDIISKYANKHISIEDAKNALIGKEVNIRLGSNMAKQYAEIMLYEEPSKQEEVVEVVDNPIDEPVVVEVKEEVETPIDTESKFKRSRRRHSRKNEE